MHPLHLALGDRRASVHHRPPVLALLALVATATPAIDVYTFGPGDDIFSHFGHSAICVQEGADDRCYNFGTADFSTPLPLTRDFIRGRASFWVSVVARGPMLAYYRESDRTTWRQRLELTPAEARALADDLRQSARGESRYYLYHHYLDNCTTRVRDAVDRATGARLRAASGASTTAKPTFREYTRRGFAEQPALLLLTQLILGRGADRPTTAWEAMFLPSELMAGLATPAIVEYRRTGPLPADRAPPVEWLFALLGGLIGLPLLLTPRRAARVVAGLVLGTLALLPWTLALASSFAELRYNEVLLVLWPTDLLLGAIPQRTVVTYARLRLLALTLVAVAQLAGLSIQPLGPLMLLVGLPLFAILHTRSGTRIAPARGNADQIAAERQFQA